MIRRIKKFQYNTDDVLTVKDINNNLNSYGYFGDTFEELDKQISCNLEYKLKDANSNSVRPFFNGNSVFALFLPKNCVINLDREMPKSGEIYQHFSGEFYKIICLAQSDNNEKLVIYQHCNCYVTDYRDGETETDYIIDEKSLPYAMSLEDFMSVLKNNDSIVKQNFTFEKISEM